MVCMFACFLAFTLGFTFGICSTIKCVTLSGLCQVLWCKRYCLSSRVWACYMEMDCEYTLCVQSWTNVYAYWVVQYVTLCITCRYVWHSYGTAAVDDGCGSWASSDCIAIRESPGKVVLSQLICLLILQFNLITLRWTLIDGTLFCANCRVMSNEQLLRTAVPFSL